MPKLTVDGIEIEVPAGATVIASEARQPSTLRQALDCRVATLLARTKDSEK